MLPCVFFWDAFLSPNHQHLYAEPLQIRITTASVTVWNSLPEPVCNPNSTEAAFRRLLKKFYSRGTSAPRALGGLLCDTLTFTFLQNDTTMVIHCFRPSKLTQAVYWIFYQVRTIQTLQHNMEYLPIIYWVITIIFTSKRTYRAGLHVCVVNESVM